MATEGTARTGSVSGSIDDRRTTNRVELSRSRWAGRRSRTVSAKRIDYTSETTRPIVSLAFVLPLLLIYEFGSIWSGNAIGKSGVDQWLEQLMGCLGMGHLVILPLATTGILLFLHHRLEDHWQIRPRVLLGMLAESFALGLILFFAGNAIAQAFDPELTRPAMQIAAAKCPPTALESSWSKTISYIGSGVYEELVFRLILLTGVIHVSRQKIGARHAQALGIIVTSLLFAAMHYNVFNPAGAIFDLYGFSFRLLASVVFCVLFLYRGFGIAAGTHALYDVMTQI